MFFLQTQRCRVASLFGLKGQFAICACALDTSKGEQVTRCILKFAVCFPWNRKAERSKRLAFARIAREFLVGKRPAPGGRRARRNHPQPAVTIHSPEQQTINHRNIYLGVPPISTLTCLSHLEPHRRQKVNPTALRVSACCWLTRQRRHSVELLRLKQHTRSPTCCPRTHRLYTLQTRAPALSSASRAEAPRWSSCATYDAFRRP